MNDLVDEREFLLRSLRDLEAEREAGDIDDTDYETLKRDYTARAAAVIKAIEGPGSANGSNGRRGPTATATGQTPASAPGRRSWRVPVAAGLIVGLAVLAGWAVASSAGDRTAGQNITGSVPGDSGSGATASQVEAQLTTARQQFSDGKVLDAIKSYDAVLKVDPKQPEALAYRGWLLHLAGVDDQGLVSLTAAVQADPTYADAHFFRGEVLCTFSHDQQGAITEFQQFLANNPPAEFASLVQQRLQNAKTGSCAPGAKADFGPTPPGAAPPTSAPPATTPSTTAKP